MKPVLVLTIIGFCSALLLSIINEVTKESIASAKARLKLNALSEIFPFELTNVRTIEEKGATFFEITDENQNMKGVGVLTFTEKGYGGRIEVLLAVSKECTIYDYKVLSHTETPGLGDKITGPKFRNQFKNKTLSGWIWKVKKDGGFVDELTAATISSRGITDAISRGLELFSNRYQGRCK